MKNSIFAVLLAATAPCGGAAVAQQSLPQAQYSAEELARALSSAPTEAADVVGECAQRGMVAGEDGVCEPAKDDTRGFSLPNRADPAKGATRGFSLPNRTAAQTPRPAARPSATAAARPRATPARAASTTRPPAGTQLASANIPSPSVPSSLAKRDLLISFETGSAQLTQQAQANAKVFAQALQLPQLASARFEIQGHTDATGSRADNLFLSQRRADAVRTYLISLGVDPQRLEARGYGFDQLAAPSNPRSPENRRVEVSRLN